MLKKTLSLLILVAGVSAVGHAPPSASPRPSGLGMTDDSPVKFPASGALPSKYPPDRRVD